jgi:curli biogenesis system outer membrane secretion channel CsgG
MKARRHFVCLLLGAHTILWAQAPLPPPPPPMPSGYGQQPNMPMPQVPYQKAPVNAPTSLAATRFTALPTVAIREFRSSVSEVTPRGATDMFIAALVKSRKFRVLERSRMAEGVGAEKALNQQGMTTGQVGQSQYLGATYVFEATISEASAGDQKGAFTMGVAGAAAGRGWSSDSIAIDVRVTDVDSGIVVDAVTVRKELKSVETKAAGVTSALANLLTRGRGGAVAEALTPNDQYINARKDSVDKTLRDAIDEAVNELAKRFVKDELEK